MKTSERLADWSTRYAVEFSWDPAAAGVRIRGWSKLPIEVREILETYRELTRAWLRDGIDQVMPGPLVEEVSPGLFRCSIPRQYRGPKILRRLERVATERMREELVEERRDFQPRNRFEEEALGRSRHEG